VSLISSIADFLKPTPTPTPKVRKALERVGEIVDPLLKSAPGFERELAPAVEHVLGYCEGLIAALSKAAERFREYEYSHAAKGSIDGDHPEAEVKRAILLAIDRMQERVRAETERCEGIVAARKPGAIARWPRCVKSPSPHTGAQDHDRAS
jgi:hypothetical protein